MTLRNQTLRSYRHARGRGEIPPIFEHQIQLLQQDAQELALRFHTQRKLHHLFQFDAFPDNKFWPVYKRALRDPALHDALLTVATQTLVLLFASLNDGNREILPAARINSLFINMLAAVPQTNTSWPLAALQLQPYTTDDARDVRDMMTEFTQLVVVPSLLERLKPSAQAEWPLHDIYAFHNATLVQELLPEVMACFFEQRDAVTILGLSRRWHDHDLLIPPDLRPLAKPPLNWEPLTRKEITVTSGLAEGCRLVCLTTLDELSSEGDALQHCVGGYAPRCGRGQSHIFSIQSPGGKRLSTFELSPWEKSKNAGQTFSFRDGTKFTLVQHKSHYNTKPPSESLQAIEWFRQQIEQGNIPCNDRHVRYLPHKNASGALYEIGFQISEKNIEAMFREFRATHRAAYIYQPNLGEFTQSSRHFIAGSLVYKTADESGKERQMEHSYRKMTAREWMAATGLEDVIRNYIRSHSLLAAKQLETRWAAMDGDLSPHLRSAITPHTAEISRRSGRTR